jgi:hypothetical protein
VPCFTNLECDDYVRLCCERGLVRKIDDLAAKQASQDLRVELVVASREVRMIEALEHIVAALEDWRSGPYDADRCSAV